VTEEFLGEALEFYRLKYGKSVKYGDYEIILIPYVEVVEK
jgi:hypothetical protein